ncbi:MAG: hypothetical protein ACKOZU_11010 [Planctomycetaceae bacterium]
MTRGAAFAAVARIAMAAAGRSVAETRAATVAQARDNIRTFLADAGGGPWFFFFGPSTTHRGGVKGSGPALWGIDLDAIRGRRPPGAMRVPPWLAAACSPATTSPTPT